MTKIDNFPFHIKEAQYLADLTGIRADLWEVEIFVQQFCTIPKDCRIDILQIKQALCLSALIKFGRTAGTGVRQKLSEDMLKALPPKYLVLHQYFKDLRDKWAAHSVNNFEESRITLQAEITDSGEIIPLNIYEGHKNTVHLSQENMIELGNLCRELGRIIQEELIKERNNILSLAKSKDLSILKENPDAFATIQSPEIHNKPRAKFRNK